MKVTLKLIAVAAGIGAAVLAIGQFRSMNSTVDGSGSFRLSGTRYDVDKASLVLGDSGRMEFVVYGDRTFRFEGRYTRLSDSRVRLNVDDMAGSSASGSVIAEIDGRYRLTSLDGSGDSRRGRWSVDFNSDRGGSDWGGSGGSWDRPSMDETRSGSGRFTRGSTTRDVARATVKLDRNGRASIRFSGGLYSWSLSGTWNDAGSRGYRLNITDGLDSSRTVGSGYVSHDGDRLTKITLSGLDGSGKNYNLNFSADRFGGSGGSGDWGGSGSNNEAWVNRSETRNGTGELRSETGQKFWMDKAFVNMKEGGRFEIAIYGERTYRFSGTWRRTSDHGADLTVTNGYGPVFGMGDARGTGRIWFSGRRFSGFEFKTKSDGIDRSIHFRAD